MHFKTRMKTSITDFRGTEIAYTPEELEKFRAENEAGVNFEGRYYTLYEATQRQRKYKRTIRYRSGKP